mgnify:CR=1 FL=1
MAAVHKRAFIAAPIERVWAALTVPAAIREWMFDDDIRVDLRPGGSYAFFDGETTGTFTRIEPPHRLSYSWRQSTWPREWGDSVVHWELEPDPEGTRIHLIHDGFPNPQERDAHDEGWDIYFLGPLQDWLEEQE